MNNLFRHYRLPDDLNELDLKLEPDERKLELDEDRKELGRKLELEEEERKELGRNDGAVEDLKLLELERKELGRKEKLEEDEGAVRTRELLLKLLEL